MIRNHTSAAAILLGLTVLLGAGCGEECNRFPVAPALSDHLLVEPDGTGDWPTVQAAIDRADSLDVIELADGVFRGDGNRDVDFRGKTIAVRSRSGDPERCVIDCEGSQMDPHLGFRFHSGESALARLEGLTIRGAYGIAGGAVICDRASPTLANCRFVENFATAGAGLKCTNDADPIVLHCLFENNDADVGAGVFIQWAAPYFRDCEFRNNRAQTTGGGMSTQSSSFIMHDCLFRENVSAASAGGLAVLYGSPRLTDVTFRDNEAATFAGGLSLHNVDGAELAGCVIVANSAEASAGGLHGTGTIVVSATLIAGNTAGVMGGGAACEANLAVSGCTIADNTAPVGAGIHVVGGGALALTSSILAFNAGGGVVSCGENAMATLACCDVFGHAGGDWTGCLAGQASIQENFSADPLFFDTEEGDFRLAGGSPCLSVPGCGTLGWAPRRQLRP